MLKFFGTALILYEIYPYVKFQVYVFKDQDDCIRSKFWTKNNDLQTNEHTKLQVNSQPSKNENNVYKS